jgi:uncharacterized C2H2 Zn-finger protein
LFEADNNIRTRDLTHFCSTPSSTLFTMYLAQRAVSASGNGALSHGAIAGIVVGVVVFVAAIIFGIRTYLRRRSKKTVNSPIRIVNGRPRRFSRSGVDPFPYYTRPAETALEHESISGLLQRVPSEKYRKPTLINPCDLEYRPNPVIFAHLADIDFEDAPRSNEASQSNLGPLEISSGPECVSEQRALKRRMSGLSDVIELEGYSNRGEALTVTPTRTKRRAYSRQSTRELDSSISCSFPSRPPNSSSIVPTKRSSPANQEPRPEHASSDQPQRNTLASGSIAVESTRQSSAPSNGDQSLTCPECEVQFRTSGQRREHQNRKHIRRFRCDICERAFNLQADLSRHERTVHKVEDGAMVGGDGECALKCPNRGCKTADKVWDRKDNLARHVVRCRKALGKVT